MPKPETILQMYSQVARDIILQDFHVGSCIASTLVTIRVLNHFGIAAEPFPCVAFAWNPRYARCIERGDIPPENISQPELEKWLDKRDAWGIAVGVAGGKTVDGKPGWEGHLVAVLRKEHLLVDASIDQVNRPIRNIYFPGVIVGRANQSFLDCKESAWFHINGCALEYQPRPTRTNFTNSGDWVIPARTNRAVHAIVEVIKTLL